MHVNKRELADLIGHDETTITQWQKNERLPVLQVGRRGQAHTYDSIAVIQWLINREVAERVGERTDGAGKQLYDKDEEMGRKLHHEADKIELDVQERKGELTETAEVVRQFGERAQRGARMLMRHADTIAELHLEQATQKTAKEAYLLVIEKALNTWLDNEHDTAGGGAESSVGAGEAAPAVHA